MGQTVVRVEGLRVAYGERVVLRDVGVTVQAGEVVAVIGNSGCGKSTLLKAIVGLVVPQAGRIELFGRESTQLSPAERDPLLRRCGVMFQQGALLNSLTVGANVALPLEMHTDLPLALREEVAQARLEMVGLATAFGQLPAELSGGMRKRAALARAMALDPEILFCDEPGAGLDPVTAAEIDELLLVVNRNLGTALVVVTHELLSIARLNGRIVMLEGGACVFSGPLAQARRSEEPAVRRFFDPDGRTPRR
jgi:phospholipid/cholesterol/gamma-HCH transport system ATP-binding protein